MPTFLSHVIRAAGSAVVLVLVSAILLLGWDYFHWLRTIGSFRHFAIGYLEAFLASYFPVLITGALATVVLGPMIRQSRLRLKPARWLLLSSSIVLGLFLAEVVAAAWLCWIHRLPALPQRFVAPARSGDEILIVVIGESSALGVPYEDWLSVGMIIGNELTKAIPAHRFRVNVLAEKGATLEAMHKKLASLTSRPDALIVYAGHNEFLARFSVWNRVAYYSDDSSFRRGGAWLERAGRFSPLYNLALETLEKRRVSVIPTRSLGTTETVIGRPVCTPDEANAILVDFQRRLEAIVADCERIGCLPILVIPPGNDAFDPNQSHATPSTGAAARQALFRHLEEIRAIEEQDPDRAILAYQDVVAVQPTHAQARYRLARLLESAGSYAEANRHYILARDHDGLPLRCVSSLEAAYRTVASRHTGSVLLVDGPAALRTKSRHGILDSHLFHDNVHPNLVGHVALAEAVLNGLKARVAFDWPESTSAPVLDPRGYADQYGINAVAWAAICDRSAAFLDQIAFLTLDSGERVKWRDHYAMAARQIRIGTRPENVGIPGVGIIER